MNLKRSAVRPSIQLTRENTYMYSRKNNETTKNVTINMSRNTESQSDMNEINGCHGHTAYSSRSADDPV